MNGFIRLVIVSAMIASLISCASQQPVDDTVGLDGDNDAAVTSDNPSPVKDSGAGHDDFADFDNDQPASGGNANQAAAPSAPATPAGKDDLSIENELDQANGGDTAQTPALPSSNAAPEAPVAPPAAADTANNAPQAEDPFADNSAPAAPAPAPEQAAAQAPAPTPEPPAPEITTIPAPTTAAAPVADSNGAPAKITNLTYKGNASGGTIVVEGNKPLAFTTRTNADLHQLVVEVNNAVLPDRLKRSLNTKDIKGSIGAVDAYQNTGSNTARFVIQLREGVGEPAVQAEGNNLLIVASGAPVVKEDTPEAVEAGPVATAETVEAGGEQNILANQTLSEFMSGTSKFYGKKISIEMNNMDIHDALNFITEESGVNMVVAEEVKGTVSLKLRQVPWDQALVLIMRAKKLGYTRQGSVLRIAPLSDLRAEEEDATKLAQARRALEPLRVRMFPISYAKVEDLEKRLKDFLGERGKAVGDARTNSLVVTDLPENMDRIAKLVSSLDTQPSQVLIEGKIVEATESFNRRVGVEWGMTGSPVGIGNTSKGPVNLTPTASLNTGGSSGGGSTFGLNIGTLDFLGNLSAALALSETEGLAKVISSPRVVTLTNEKANINQTTEVPIKTITTIAGGTSQETYQYKSLALKLEVTPQITFDGSVIMQVAVQRQFLAPQTGTASTVAPVDSREATTKVLVKNGQTAVIGGIFTSDVTDGESGLPWFRELPVVGSLFKTKTVDKEKSELLIFVTPKILSHLDANNADTPTPAL